tara:strand:+ start:80148 stop:80972 length:825 start_codon:yes stop_codon:yes gene_type:complete
MTKDCLYIGTVFHKRYAPKKHELKYKVFTLFADLDQLHNTAKKNRLFSLNRFNLVSFHEADYGNPNSSKSTDLKERLLELLASNGIDTSRVETIKVLAYPRVLGFAFNPLTVFYCYGKNDKNVAVIYEVRNTFSERHNYIYAVPDNATFKDQHTAEKCFHVSPFFDRQGTYNFSLVQPDEKVAVTIDYEHSGQSRLTACFSGNRKEISDRALLELSLKMPFMTLKVMGGILIEAIKLKLKGLKIYPHSDRHAYQSSEALTITKKQHKEVPRDTK